MKKEINLTTVAAIPDDLFQLLLDEFEAQSNVHVNLNIIGWETYRAEFVSIALQRRPVDVSIVGTPITSDLLGMNVLRPFSIDEINKLGGQAAFLPARWQSGIRPGSDQVWAVPWMVDLRVLYYWRDMLAAAGVEEAAAFHDPAHVFDTFQKLKRSGVPAPYSAPTERYAVLHTVASWIWANGGNLFQPDGKKVIFHEMDAMQGIREYFNLLQFANRESGYALNRDPIFLERKSAVTIGNGWGVTQDLPENLGCAPVPGGSYLGGPDLIVWGNTRNEPAALELVRFLTLPATQWKVSRMTGLLPSYTSELKTLANDPSPVRRTLAQAALTGRTFPCVPMIGLVEDRLSTIMSQIQQELMAHPDADIETLLISRLIPLGNRTNISLS